MTDPQGDLLLIELTSQETGGIVKAAISPEKAIEEIKNCSQTAMNLAMGTVRAAAYRFARTIQQIEHDIRPDEVEVEFVIKLELHGGMETGQVTSMIAKAEANGGAEGQFTVKFKWNVEKPKAAEVVVSDKK